MESLENYLYSELCNKKKEEKCVEFLNKCTKFEFYKLLDFLGKYQYVNPTLTYNVNITNLLFEKLKYYED